MNRVRFGDVVIDVKNNIDRKNNPYEFYVAGDHMDSEDLTIHRKGCFATDDVGPAFVREFKKGQVLYGSRRTYLKKVAVADFDGVTANTTFVLETKDNNILLQSLLPFIMLSNDFTNWSISKSKGSTNPYVLFSDLAEYEFVLPDIEEQRKLSDVLWMIKRTKDAYKALIEKSDEFVKSQFVEMFGDPIENPKGLPLIKLSVLADLITKGASPNWQGYGYTEDKTQTLFVTSENVREGALDLAAPKYLEDGFNEKQKRSMLKKGDFLINIVGASIGRAARFDLDVKANINQAVALVRMGKEKVVSNYMLYYLNSPKALEMYEAMKSAVARANLSLQNIGDLEILVPPIDQQEQFAEFIEQIDKSKLAIKESLESLERGEKAIMVKTFG